MKITKTLTLIAAIAAVTVTAASAELPTRRETELYVAPGNKRQIYRNTQEIRTLNSDRRQRETESMSGEFASLSDRVQLLLEAKFGGPAEALKHADAIKYDCYFHATAFCRKYNKSDSASYAYEMQEHITVALQEKAIKVANRANTLANTLANN